ncbi:MAG: alpha/beta fold hydrolase [Gammaproteobacteria bacterium]|nr:alpha/beta fold hydrolase [Gammaproteobacteria bacterium]MBV8404571.1 alpha/beta fold hydrolase [Gammaproteobacteria bacterium]
MARPPQAERLSLAGPAGAVEALIEVPDGANARTPAACGVICHPHPLHGGTLDNKVVWTLARAFQELGAPTVRFNFRGVGASAGTYAEGDGEVGDALAAIEFARGRWPQAPLWLAGFSFGGVIALRAAAAAHPACLVTVAPGITRIEVGDAPRPECPWLIVQGADDDVVPAAAVSAWALTLSPPPELRVLQGAGHFFHGRINELRDCVVAFMRRVTASA